MEAVPGPRRPRQARPELRVSEDCCSEPLPMQRCDETQYGSIVGLSATRPAETASDVVSSNLTGQRGVPRSRLNLRALPAWHSYKRYWIL